MEMRKSKESVWDDSSLLSTLEKQRDQLKQVGKKMTYECLNAVVSGDRVRCKLGKALGTADDGSVALITVLRGICSGTCKSCMDYNAEKEENSPI